MSRSTPALTVETPLRPATATLTVVAATARVFLLRFASNPIMVIRGPLSPVLILMSFHLVYVVSGQAEVEGQDAMAYLVIGMLATLAWSSTVWGAGNALQSEIYQGTIRAVLVAPQPLGAVIVGHGIGSMLYNLPALLVSVVTGWLLGADVHVAHPLAALASLLLLYASCLCVGVGFGGLFLLSRQSNALSNFLQQPVYLLAGFFVPRSVLPGWLQPVSDAFPVSHAVDALRRTVLSGASFADIAPVVAATVVTSAAFLGAGVLGLRRLDTVVRRHATLDPA